jgi:signal transduction histidine kinase
MDDGSVFASALLDDRQRRLSEMEGETVRVLLVDDDEDDFVMARDLLAEITSGARYDLEWIAAYEEAVERMKQCVHDVCLLDYQLGRRTGLELMREAQEGGCNLPIILLTGQGDREVDVEAMKAGAMDYLVKGEVDPNLLERSIRYAIERKRVDQLKDRLIAFASHELRTPITAVRGYAETLLLQEGDGLGGVQVELLGYIIQAADHLTRLIDGFLDVSRIDAGRPIELVKEEFDVAGMVEEAVEIVRMAGRRSDFAVEYDEGVSTLCGDRYKLLLVLINLLSNADKYSPAHSVVHVRVTTPNNAVRFAVTDEGPGIPKAVLKDLFTPFYRVSDPQQREARGTGLGLCLCKYLVEAHGGTIRVDSEPGRGTTASFTVPREDCGGAASRGERPDTDLDG